METLTSVLPIVIYILLIGLLIISIILGIKLIMTIDKVNKVVDNVENKVNSLNGLFSIIDTTSHKMTFVYEKVIDFLGTIVDKLFLSKKKGTDEDYE